jgi:uncharacterized membrane protein
MKTSGIKGFFDAIITYELIKTTFNLPNLIVLSVSLIWFLSFQTNEGLWYDECFSYFHSQGTKEDIFLVSTWDSNPPIYLFIVKVWVKMIGFSEVKLRLLSLLFSAINTVILFAWIRNKLGNIASIFFVALVLLSNVQIEYANEARVYSWIFLLITISNLLFLRFLSQPKILIAFSLGVTYTLIFYSHYIEGIIVLVHGIFLLIYVLLTRKELSDVIINYLVKYSMGCLLFFYAIYKGQIFFSNLLQSGGNRIVDPPMLYDVPRVISELFNDSYVFVFFIASIFLLWLFNIFKRNQILMGNEEIILFHLVFSILSFFVLYIVSSNAPMFTRRYLMFTTIPVFITLTFITFSVHEKWKSYSVAIFSVLIFSFAFSMKTKFNKQMEIREAVEYVKTHKSKNTLIIIHTKDIVANFSLYFDNKIFSNYFLQVEQLARDGVIAVNELDSTLKKLNYSFFDKVFVFRVFSSTEFEKDLDGILNDCFLKAEKIDKFRGVEINVYSNPSQFIHKSNTQINEYFNYLTVSQYIQKIQSDLKWFKYVKDKALEMNRNLDSVLFEEAEWVMNEDLKRLKYSK